MGDAHYEFADASAHERFSSCRPIRLINRDLGYPIAVVDDDGSYLVPPDEDFEEENFLATQTRAWLGAVQKCRRDGWPRVENKTSRVHGVGVFAAQDIPAGATIGFYNGTVYTQEAWDELERLGESRTDNFLFNLNDGAHGIVLDGCFGKGINALKFLNHSCSPNVRMQEVFLQGSWAVLVVALRDIATKEELSHDFALHTEDANEAETPCTCGAAECRGKLYAYFPWDDGDDDDEDDGNDDDGNDDDDNDDDESHNGTSSNDESQDKSDHDVQSERIEESDATI
ncbi:Histone-lysine N-methyltransferase trithorax [Hondaea fermentalgiana]|uniref:Histone-lysine N-methyltransferase trithorax n=1 Tax=Hondaea fermentalgiana TaxID=2315210 RepID=A0A2R5G4W9_9STRA|nr:Histone-lysine N-methyltransferase trithorax [Hondaea fermentalgiana]|eukprot:GBG26066.1 Histone-lysine N-methyltransferase trithorax [Hondaea fermentalgiana]